MDSVQTETPGLIKLLAWAEVNKRRLAIGAAAAVVVIALTVVVVQYQLQKEVRASEALSDVRATLNLSTPQPLGLPEAYLKVAGEHAGTKAAARALLLAAGALYAESQYAEAQKQFERLPREYPDSPWAAQAAVGAAASLEAQQKTPDAIAKYEEVRRRYGSDPVIDEAKLSLGKLYDQQGKSEEAFKLYEDVMKSGMSMQSGLAMEASARQDDLIKRYPDLVKPKMPILPTAVPTPGMSNLQIQNLKGSNASLMSLSNLMKRAATNLPALTPTNRAATNAGTILKTNEPDKK